jgi:pimeloyl-ACP methyl ester carboxylesterase
MRLQHGRIGLALHELRADGGSRLLLLHGLGERSPARVPEWLAGWTGGIWALDFSGHGESDVPPGGGYCPEILMADADAALAHLGPVSLFGRGVGAYVALLLAGARGDDVRGAVLGDGPGLAGGGPDDSTLSALPDGLATVNTTPDQLAVRELSRDIRRPSYAADFARAATAALIVTARERPPWLRSVLDVAGKSALTDAKAIEMLGARS